MMLNHLARLPSLRVDDAFVSGSLSERSMVGFSNNVDLKRTFQDRLGPSISVQVNSFPWHHFIDANTEKARAIGADAFSQRSGAFTTHFSLD